MTVHKLSAGDGYTYLTRQVASADAVRPAGQGLADYYTAWGNPPGVWLGSGAAALGVAGTAVSEAQMKALFGQGCHPDTGVALGRRFARYEPQGDADARVEARVIAFEVEAGRSPTAAERRRFAAQQAHRGRRAVAGFDLVFTPVKSASLLWALGGPQVRAEVEAAHHEAVAQTVAWLETHAAFTRTGKGGHAQVDTTGLVCAAFDHRESRTGDPDLHTHVAVSNKVCGVDGLWRALDARGLHALGVAASERYNTRFEDALTRRLGTWFVERPGGAAGKRAVREVDGVPVQLIRHFSRRRAAIEDRLIVLASEFRASHGREPDRATQLRLAQRATLETRDGKPPARCLGDQVKDWTGQAVSVLGRSGVDAMLTIAVGRPQQAATLDVVDVEMAARQVLATVSSQRSTWTRWNVVAEVERVLRPVRFASVEERDAATGRVVEAATGPGLSIRIAEPELVAEPLALRRASDGQSVFVPHGSERYTSGAILLAEESLVDAARTPTSVGVDPIVVEAALAVHEARSGVRLDDGQRELVAAFATSGRRLVLGIGPAGAGKTTAMQAFAAAWVTSGGRVVPLAASSKAAQILGAELEVKSENIHKFLHETRRLRETSGTEQSPMSSDDWFRLTAGDVVLVDEAGMAGTLLLAELVQTATEAGAVVRLLGDPAQLASVEAGGALRLLEAEVGAVQLDRLHRFDDPAEAAATLRLRSGDPSVVDFYQTRGRIRCGSRDAMLDAAYDGWAADVSLGKTSVLVAATADDVAALNVRARTERVAAGHVEATGVELRDGTTAGVGDWVVTRTNVRGLTCHRGRDWVKNGDSWQVVARHKDGALTVRHLTHHGKVRIPAAYVGDQIELAYATTAHRAQGTTVDTAHPLVTSEQSREALYVASTRARTCTTWYVATEELIDPGGDHQPDPPSDARTVLAAVIARTGAETSATQTIRTTLEDATRLPTLVARYQHAWTLAATQTLRDAATRVLPAGVAARLLSDDAAPGVARCLAEIAGTGLDPADVLRSVADSRDLASAASVAKVLEYRLEDYAAAPGHPRLRPPAGPLPWLPNPDVGHRGWSDYLTQRAQLISRRAAQLATPDDPDGVAAARREQHGLPASPESGPPELTEVEPNNSKNPPHRHVEPPVRSRSPDRRGPSLRP